jgi:hypothetical protein
VKFAKFQWRREKTKTLKLGFRETMTSDSASQTCKRVVVQSHVDLKTFSFDIDDEKKFSPVAK